MFKLFNVYMFRSPLDSPSLISEKLNKTKHWVEHLKIAAVIIPLCVLYVRYISIPLCMLCIVRQLSIMSDSERLTFIYINVREKNYIMHWNFVDNCSRICSLLASPFLMHWIRLNLHIKGEALYSLLACNVYPGSLKPPFWTIFTRHHTSASMYISYSNMAEDFLPSRLPALSLTTQFSFCSCMVEQTSSLSHPWHFVRDLADSGRLFLGRYSSRTLFFPT